MSSVLVPVRTGPVFSLPGMMAVAGPMAVVPVRGAMANPPPRGVIFPSGSTALARPLTAGQAALAQRLSVRSAAQRDGANNVPFTLRLHNDLGPTALIATVVSLETDASGGERVVERQVTVAPTTYLEGGHHPDAQQGDTIVEVPANAVALALTSRNGPVPLPWDALVNEWRPMPRTNPPPADAPATAAQIDPYSPAHLSDDFVRRVSSGQSFIRRHGKHIVMGGLAAALVAGVVYYSRQKSSDDDEPRDNPGCSGGCGPSCGCAPCREKYHGKGKTRR